MHTAPTILLATLTATHAAAESTAHRPTPAAQPRIFYEIDIGGVSTWDAFGAAANERLAIHLGAFAHITAIEWDVTIATVGNSWLSEAGFAFLDSPTTLSLFPGVGNDFSGTGTFSSAGVFTLPSNDYFDVGADGLLEIEFFESFDDAPNAIDAAFLPGSVIRVLVPAPPSVAALLALAGDAARRRRA